jgi:hypothetical protein
MSFAPILAATCLFLVGHAEAIRPKPDLTYRTGDIALSDWPFCAFLVIHTPKGFALVVWQDGMWFFAVTPFTASWTGSASRPYTGLARLGLGR